MLDGRESLSVSLRLSVAHTMKKPVSHEVQRHFNGVMGPIYEL